MFHGIDSQKVLSTRLTKEGYKRRRYLIVKDGVESRVTTLEMPIDLAPGREVVKESSVNRQKAVERAKKLSGTLSPQEIADKLGVARDTVYRYLSEGKKHD